MTLVDDMIRQNKTISELTAAGIEACILAKIPTINAEVCRGIIPKFAPEYVYIATNAYTDPRDICIDVGVCTRARVRKDRLVNPSAAHLSRPAVPRSVSELRAESTVPGMCGSGGATGTFVHVTDMHIDLLYAAGTNSNCDMPECCRVVNGPGVPPNVAGKFGNYDCDSAPILIQSLGAQLAALNPKPDFVIWTGDFPGNDVWEDSPTEILTAAKYLADALSTALPNVTVYPSIGNHEGYPINQFQGPGKDAWLNSGLADIWARWLPADAVTAVRFGAFYSTAVAVAPGLRLISLHTMLGNGGSQGNYWLLLNRTDPAQWNDLGHQLDWLNTTLDAAQNAGEKVYIIGHIPTGDGGMIPSYANRIHSMVARHSTTVAGLFFGHTHMDHFEIVHDLATNTIPIGIAYITPSVTTQTNINPSFRVNTYDRTTFEVLDWAQYRADLDSSNQAGSMLWKQAYSPRQAYGMSCLRPNDWQNLVQRMSTNYTLFNTFMSNHATGRPFTCDAPCTRDFLCALSSFTPTLHQQCSAS